MEIDTIVELDDGKKYLLLLEENLNDDDYFLSVLLDSNEEPTKEYAILKEIYENGETFVEEEYNPEIMIELLKHYQLQYEDHYENNKNVF